MAQRVKQLLSDYEPDDSSSIHNPNKDGDIGLHKAVLISVCANCHVFLPRNT